MPRPPGPLALNPLDENKLELVSMTLFLDFKFYAPDLKKVFYVDLNDILSEILLDPKLSPLPL